MASVAGGHAGTLLSILMLHALLARGDLATREYCEDEVFKADCSRDEVVIMQSAYYGRMRLGRCVKMNMGYIGCEADVLDLADQRCSGKHKCRINVPDTIFERTRPCFELKSYLEVGYTCVRVASARPAVCQTAKYVKLTSSSAFLSSQVTQETGCGTALCPWVIEVPRGQRINVTLLDYGWSSRRDNGDNFNTLQVCQKYAVLREMSQTKSITICGSSSRESQVYVSDTNQLEVYLTPKGSTEGAQYLLKYDAIGCPDLSPPPNAVFKRINPEQGLVACKYAPGQQWNLKCKGTIWVGSVGNCTHYSPRKSGQFLIGNVSMPHGIAVAIVAGVAIVIGMLILTVGLVIFKRHMRRKEEEEMEAARHHHIAGTPIPCPNEILDCREEYLSPADGLVDNYPTEYKTGTVQKNKSRTYMTKNEYTHIWEMPLPNPQEGTLPTSP